MLSNPQGYIYLVVLRRFCDDARDSEGATCMPGIYANPLASDLGSAFPKAEFGDQKDSTTGRMSLLHVADLVLVPKASLGVML